MQHQPQLCALYSCLRGLIDMFVHAVKSSKPLFLHCMRVKKQSTDNFYLKLFLVLKCGMFHLFCFPNLWFFPPSSCPGFFSTLKPVQICAAQQCNRVFSFWLTLQKFAVLFNVFGRASLDPASLYPALLSQTDRPTMK